MTSGVADTKAVHPVSPIISASAADLFRSVSVIASVFVFGTGVLVIFGWVFNVEILKILYFSPIQMKANAAIAFVLTGLSLWFVQTKRASSRTRLISRSCASVIALIGLLTLFEYLFNLDIGIDQALFVDMPDTAITSNAGRMAPFTAVDFVLIGIALFLIDVEVRWRLRPSQFIAIVMGLIALISLMGYIYGIASIYKLSLYNAMALHTAVAFLMASIGILTARPDKGIMIFLVRDSIGSVMARRLLIATLLTPLLIDIILVSGQMAGLYGVNHTLAIDDILLMFILMGIVLHTSIYLNKIDDQRKQAEEEIKNIARFPNDNPFPVIRIDRELNVTYINNASKLMLANLGFHYDGDSFIADAKWHDLITGALDSRQVKSVEIPVDGRVFHFTIAPIQDMDYVNLYGYDITQRKSAEKALNFEKNKLQNILNSMQDGIYIVNHEHKIEYANPVVIGEFGHYKDLKCFAYFHGLNSACPWCRNEEVFQEKKTIRWELTMPTTGKTYDIIDTPLTNQDGSISKMEIFRDITARKLMENDLRLFSQAIEETIDNVHIADMAGKIIYANKAAAKMTGYSFVESVGMDVVNLLKDRDFAKNVIIPAIYFKGAWEGEILCEKKDGTPYLGWLAATLFNNTDGKPIAMIGTLRDITEKKAIEEACRAAEQNMSALMNAITESVALMSSDGVFITVNDTFSRRFSKESSEIVGKSLKDILNPTLLESRNRHFNEVISTGKSVHFEDTRDEFNFSTNFYPVFNNNNEVSGVAMYADDVTLRKKYENDLLSSIKEKEVLMREVHHRVKNNLQIVAGLVGLQLNYVEDEKYRAMFVETRDRIKSIALVHDKLYRSKGLADVDLKIYISELAKELFSSFGIDKDAIELTLDVENVVIGVDIAVPCGLIINELFTNILKYAFPDKTMGVVTISIAATDGDKFEMVISDNGVGFPEDVNFRKTKSLGLHIVNLLVKQIGGTIELDNTQGSRFTIKFDHPQNQTDTSKGA
ncbi:MAG: PAS domain S-box protein [Nitrospirae bacterium]|nr:PAS domain S-box protein [Nitrospirota bacterium]